jgi:ParB family chromosome partitioning protein
MAKRRSLGRGLDALLSGGSSPPVASGEPGLDTGDDTGLRELPVDLLQRGRYQPRIDMREETLTELAESIRAQGIVQPIVVRPLPRQTEDTETRYEIVAGERRWRAAQMAGLDRVPALVKHIADEAALAVSLIENIQRENLNPLEEARSLQRLVAEFGLTHGEAADAVGRSRAAVSNLLRLLELPEPVREMLERRELDMGHGRALLGLGSAPMQLELARRIRKHGWSVRETERAVRRAAGAAGTANPARSAAGPDPDVKRLETELAEMLGAAVSIEHGPKGGRVVIRYHGLDELEGILTHIK